MVNCITNGEERVVERELGVWKGKWSGLLRVGREVGRWMYQERKKRHWWERFGKNQWRGLKDGDIYVLPRG